MPSLPRAPSATASSKRRLEDPTQTLGRQPAHKAVKRTNGDSPHSHSHSHLAISYDKNGTEDQASVGVDNEEDIEAGPTLPPNEPAEEEVGDDDEGRFFGGGISEQARAALDYIDRNDGDDTAADEEKIDGVWLRKTAVTFEKKITRNLDLRAKYAHQPERFIESEADLDAAVRRWGILAGYTGLYAEFVALGCVRSLVGLLGHENEDVAVQVVEVLRDLTDEDTGAEEGEWAVLVEACVEADVLGLLVGVLGGLDERREADRDGVYHVLEVLENLMSAVASVDVVGQNGKLMMWLLKRIKREGEGRARVSQNQQYAAEILAIMLQGSKGNRERFAAVNGVDTLLELLGPYRKADPEKDSDEEEWVANLFDCLTCVVEEESGGESYLSGEGVELCLIMLRDGKMSRPRGLTVLDHAMGGGAATQVCERFVDAAGLKTVFGMFMKKQERDVVEHLIGIFASLLRYQPADSAGRIRTLAKFVEKDYEKVVKLVQLREEYADRVGQVKSGATEEDADELLSRQLDAGLFSAQTLDVILAWLAAEDDGARKKVDELLKAQGTGLSTVARSMKEQLAGMEDEDGRNDETSTKAMLQALLGCLDGPTTS